LTTQRVERRLAAILAADVANYSRLMGADEEGTLARLKALRRELADPKIKEHRGRIVKTTGDGLLIEFASVVDAVRCAVEVQREMAERNAEVSPDRRIEFRMGINIGDIIREGRDIFGDGVNVAARLEGLAEPGGICVSRAVRDQVRDKLDFSFEDMGDREVKNIARPIRVHRILLGEAAGTSELAAAASATPRLALPDKPSIAVLPFQNMSGDPEQEYFADGMVEEIITALSRIRWLFVIARNSTIAYKNQAVDAKRVSRELGVRYVLEGSVRKAGKRVRITAQLIEAETGVHVWADRFDGSLDDVFDLQDQVATGVVGVIEPTLRQAEIERARRKRPDNLDAYDLYLRAWPLAFVAMPEAADRALHLLEQAIAIEPEYGAAHAFIAWCYHTRYLRAGLAEEARLAALCHARIAIATGGDDATALAVAGFIIGIFERDYETAFNAFDRSLALSPSSALAFGLSALIRAWSGDNASAIEHAERALRLSPFDPLSYNPYNALAYTHFFAGRFDEAASAAGMAAQANPRFSIPWILRTAALAKIGRIDEAKASAQRLLDVEPTFTVNSFLACNVTSAERLAEIGGALRIVGLREM
jgi:TolB-like protein/class 3 adenylate cyclase/Tfp pilus assembly protein PilF